MLALRHQGIILATALFIGAAWCGSAAGEEQSPAGTDIVVVVEGLAARASGTSAPACRQAALADALRRAVEKAVGVLVEGSTRAKNYQLVQDTIRTTAEGFVRDYRILDERLDGDTCRVKIEARVAPGSPEKSLRHICRRLREEVNPIFRVLVDPENIGTRTAEKLIANELAVLGLTVTGEAAGAHGVAVRGRVEIDALGETVEGTKVFSAGASAALSVTDSASGVVLPSVGVSLGQSVAAISQNQANQQAIEAVCKLWVQRNIPLIAAALLEPGELLAAESGLFDDRLSAPPSAAAHTSRTTDAEFRGRPVPEVTLIPSDGERLRIKPDALAELAEKLKASVIEKSEFKSLPADIAVARFKGIGISDPAAVEDVLEDLSTALVKTGVFQLVERSQLDKILQELRIQKSGLIDSATAKKLGKLAGAGAVLVGSISDRRDCFVINARLINTESGRISVAESVVVEKEAEREPVILRAGPQR